MVMGHFTWDEVSQTDVVTQTDTIREREIRNQRKRETVNRDPPKRTLEE